MIGIIDYKINIAICIDSSILLQYKITMQHNRSLFIFRQDLRLTDNTALLEAVKASREVLPVFILDSEVLQHSPTGDPRL